MIWLHGKKKLKALLITTYHYLIGNFVDIGNYYVQGTRNCRPGPHRKFCWYRKSLCTGYSHLVVLARFEVGAEALRKKLPATGTEKKENVFSFNQLLQASSNVWIFCPQKHCMYTNSTLEYTKSEAASRSGGQKWILWTSTGTLNLMNTQRNTECVCV